MDGAGNMFVKQALTHLHNRITLLRCDIHDAEGAPRR